MNSSVYEDLFTPGTELSELKFDGFLDWFVKISDVRVHWNNTPTYILSQAVFLIGGVITLIHALCLKGRLPYLWIATIIHGIAVESITYVHPDVNNFWHQQTPIIFLGRRFPIHIILLYPTFLYNSAVAVAKMKLPKWAEPFAVGLCVVLIDIPYDIISVRYMHWFWHDTDPNIYDRHYWVPWNSYFFHATFAASHVFWFHFLREKICNSDGKWLADKSIFKEILCSTLAGFLGPIGGILIFVIIYHPLHDIYNIHSEVTFFILFTVFLLIIWSGDRIPKVEDVVRAPRKFRPATFLLLFQLVLHYTTFLIIAIFFNPEDESSTGLRETVGPCDEYVPLHTAMGMVLKKRKYLCPTDYDEGYFNWKCLPGGKPPSDYSLWYTTCGVPFENRAEYITIISLISFLATVVFYNAHFKSFSDGEIFNEKYVQRKRKVN